MGFVSSAKILSFKFDLVLGFEEEMSMRVLFLVSIRFVCCSNFLVVRLVVGYTKQNFEVEEEICVKSFSVPTSVYFCN